MLAVRRKIFRKRFHIHCFWKKKYFLVLLINLKIMIINFNHVHLLVRLFMLAIRY